MSKSNDNLLRKGGKTCGFCATVAPATVNLLQCSACRSINYCNSTCQKSHWNIHKPICKQVRSQKSEVVQALGEKFSDYADRWRRQHTASIATIARLIVGSRQSSHVLVLMCDYTTQNGRDPKALVQLLSFQAYSMSDLCAAYGDVIRTNFAQLTTGSATASTSDYYRVMTMITNNDGTDSTPLCKISYLGYDKSLRPQQTVEVYQAQINRGTYDS